MSNNFISIILIVFLTLRTTKGFSTSKQYHDGGKSITLNLNQPRVFRTMLKYVKRDSMRTDISELAVESYKHNNWNLTYLYKKAAPGREKDPPIILVHPVGVGISSWFYKKLMAEFTNNPPLYAPDLIGCGLSHGADTWDPERIGLFFPLSWVEGVETLINSVALPRWREKQQSFFFPNYLESGASSSSKGCLVLVQGGLVRLNAFIYIVATL
mmetsp:Transcript_15378/g.28966  ORF Transcript_15378/g.28966 Transcript_15378/m.28966 type:complete len:213 (-) Transcript_15378:414-1052(-)